MLDKLLLCVDLTCILVWYCVSNSQSNPSFAEPSFFFVLAPAPAPVFQEVSTPAPDPVSATAVPVNVRTGHR